MNNRNITINISLDKFIGSIIAFVLNYNHINMSEEEVNIMCEKVLEDETVKEAALTIFEKNK